MKALTICQPYAHLIAIGEKWVENRTWSTDYRGPLAIHAGKSKDWLDPEDIVEYPAMVFGAVVAFARLVDCVHIDHASEDVREHQFTNGPWCWVLADVRAVDPIQCRGAQGLWDVPVIVEQQLGVACS